MNIDEDTKVAYSITRVGSNDEPLAHGYVYTPFLCDKAPRTPLMLLPSLAQSKVVIGTLNTDLSITDNIQIKFNKPNPLNVAHVIPLQNIHSSSMILIFWYNNSNLVLKINTKDSTSESFEIDFNIDATTAVVWSPNDTLVISTGKEVIKYNINSKNIEHSVSTNEYHNHTIFTYQYNNSGDYTWFIIGGQNLHLNKSLKYSTVHENNLICREPVCTDSCTMQITKPVVRTFGNKLYFICNQLQAVLEICIGTTSNGRINVAFKEFKLKPYHNNNRYKLTTTHDAFVGFYFDNHFVVCVRKNNIIEIDDDEIDEKGNHEKRFDWNYTNQQESDFVKTLKMVLLRIHGEQYTSMSYIKRDAPQVESSIQQFVHRNGLKNLKPDVQISSSFIPLQQLLCNQRCFQEPWLKNERGIFALRNIPKYTVLQQLVGMEMTPKETVPIMKSRQQLYHNSYSFNALFPLNWIDNIKNSQEKIVLKEKNDLLIGINDHFYEQIPLNESSQELRDYINVDFVNEGHGVVDPYCFAAIVNDPRENILQEKETSEDKSRTNCFFEQGIYGGFPVVFLITVEQIHKNEQLFVHYGHMYHLHAMSVQKSVSAFCSGY